MSTITRLLLISISIALLPASLLADPDPETAYEVLEAYDFPIGLLPKGVVKYELDRGAGQFNVYFNRTCRFTKNGYELKLNKKISCTISKDKIRSLQGVQVQFLLFWVDIIAVREDDDELEFIIGNASASYPAYYFHESPDCRDMND